jgi:hypothetical protein
VLARGVHRPREGVELLASLRSRFGVAGSVGVIDHLLQLGDALLVVSPSSFVDDELVGARFETEARVDAAGADTDPPVPRAG